jgi:hypothetical protein
MREKRGPRRVCVLAAALFIAALLPAAARAETHTFLNLTQLAPRDGAGTSGPANVYPSNIAVSGLSGTVSTATVTLISYQSSSPDDADVVITGPNGQKVMLMSDACGESIVPGGPAFSADNENWTFDDAAPTFVPNGGPCAPAQTASFQPSNYGDPGLDDLSTDGGPVGPYLNSLSLLAGGSPNGSWNLFMLDDNAACCFGAGIAGWALTLDIQPPPATPAAPQATGQRAAALAKCKGRKSKKARRKCRQKAQGLPL